MAGSQYDYGGDRSAVPEQDVTAQILAALLSSKKDQSRLPSARLPLPSMLGGPNLSTENVGSPPASGPALAVPGQPAALPMPGPALAVPGPAAQPDSQAARLPAPAGLVNKPQGPLQRPARRGYTVNEYKDMLQRAHDAGDDAAVAYFQSQIDKGLAQTTPEGKPIPQGGSVLNPVGQGLTFGFLDELAGLGGGMASSAISAFPETIDKGLGLLGRKLNVDPSKEGFDKGYDTVAGDIREADKEYAERHPYISAGAEIASGLALPLSLVRSGAGGLRTAVTTGAAYGAGTAEPKGERKLSDLVTGEEPEADLTEALVDRLKGAATGAAAGGVGYGALKTAGRLGRILFPPIAPKAKLPGFQAAVRTLEDAGIPVTAAEKIGSSEGRMAERMTATYFNQPNRLAERPQQLYSRLMGHSGFDPADVHLGELSDEAVLRAKDRFSARYSRVLKNANVRLPDMDPALAKIEQDFTNRFMEFEQKASINHILESFRKEIGQSRNITGEDYKRIRSGLGKLASQAGRSQTANYLQPVYKAIQGAVDDAFRAAAHPGRVKALAKIDRDYAGFKLLQDTAKSAGGPDAIGTMVNKMRAGKYRPTQDFQKLAKAYQDVLLRGYKQSSGTAENQIASGWMPPFGAIARAGGSKASAAAQNLTPRFLGPVADELQGAVPFVAGQQAPGSDLEELLKALGLAVVQ